MKMSRRELSTDLVVDRDIFKNNRIKFPTNLPSYDYDSSIHLQTLNVGMRLARVSFYRELHT